MKSSGRIINVGHSVKWTKDKVKTYSEFLAEKKMLGKTQFYDLYLDVFFKIARRYINRRDTVLDVGFGPGKLFEKLLAINCDCYGIDISQNAVELIEKKAVLKKLRIKVKIGDIVDIPYEDNKFDVIFAAEVIEHLTDEELCKSIAEVRRTLKNGGFFIGVVPYNENLDENLVICPDCHAFFNVSQHFQSFDEKK